MIDFKQLLSERESLLGTWVKLPTIETVELMALAGFDFVILDMEHSPMTMESASILVSVARGQALCPLVRVPDDSQAWIQRSLDAGASGVLVPHVDSAAEARAVGRAARFEPAGTRGVGPTTRAGGWGLAPASQYLGSAATATVVAQIESDDGIEAMPQMLDEEYVDALFVGPTDLSVSLGTSANDPEVTGRMQRVADACRSAGLPCGSATGGDPSSAASLFEKGFSFVTVSNDATILGGGAADLVQAVRSFVR